MNEKLKLSDGLLLAAQVAEELLPYHMELYSEAQKLPKLATSGLAHAHITKEGVI
jgi:hypothetical protein